MAEFGAAAELSVELAPGEAAAVRQELEDELGDIGVGGGGAAGALGGGGGAALTDGAGDLASLQNETVDLLEDILDEIESANLGGGGGGGGGGLAPLSFLAGRGLAGGGGGGAASLLTRILGASSAATAITLPGFGVRTQGGIQNPEDVKIPPSTDISDEEMQRIIQQAGLEMEGSSLIKSIFSTFSNGVGGGAVSGAASGTGSSGGGLASLFGLEEPLFGSSDAGSGGAASGTGSSGGGLASLFGLEEPLFGSSDGGTGRGGGTGTGSSSGGRTNRAKEERQRRGDTTINVDVTVESVQKDVERAMRDAKREVAREVAQQVNQNIAGTTSRTGL